MIYIISDLHAYQEKWVEQIHPVLKNGDIIVVAGDFGIGMLDGRYLPEEMFYDWISSQSYTVLIIDGNHENFNKLLAYPSETWNGGRIHKIRDNIFHLCRGEIYKVGNITIFAFGGGYSLDKSRRIEGISWWKQEMPSSDEYENAEKNLTAANHHVDYIITHTCPLETVHYLSTFNNYGIRKKVIEEQELTTFFDYIQTLTDYKKWYFGHFHTDVELWRNQTAVFNCIRELESGKIVRKWETYERF